LTPFTESVVEQTALAWLEDAGWRVAHGPDIAPDTPATYHAWRASSSSPPPRAGEGEGGGYTDIPGFCKSAPLDDVRKHGHVLTPGRYVGAAEVEDDGEPFAEKMKRLTATLREQQAEAAKLDAAIAANLKEIGYGG